MLRELVQSEIEYTLHNVNIRARHKLERALEKACEWQNTMVTDDQI